MIDVELEELGRCWTLNEKREGSFIKNNIMRNVNSTDSHTKADVTFMSSVVSHEGTFLLSEFKFMFIVRTQTREARISKNL